MANELKELDVEKLTKDCYFIACGKKFILNEKLSFDYYREFCRIQPEFAYNVTFSTLFNNVKNAFESLKDLKINAMKVSDIQEPLIRLWNIMEGVKNFEEKSDPALRICSLFLITEDENITVFDKTVMDEKINLWAKEYSINGFFVLAANLVIGFRSAYEIVLLSYSEKPQQIAMNQ